MLLPGEQTIVPDTDLFEVTAIPGDEITRDHVHFGSRLRMNDHASLLEQYIVPVIFVDDIEFGTRNNDIKPARMNDKAASLRCLPHMKKSLSIDPHFPV